MQLVEVTWNDAWQDDENFQSAHGITLTHKPLVVKTLGWLIIDDDVGMSIACERSTNGDGETFRSRTFIPRAMVQTTTPYNLSKPRAALPKKASVGEPVIRSTVPQGERQQS